MNSLPLFHRIKGARVVVVGTGEAADAKRRLVERAGGTCCGEAEAHHARLAFVALDDAGEAEAAVRRLKAKGLLVNATDRPELCDFTVPSVLDRDPVLVAVGTGGASAGLAKHLRLRLEALLPQSLGQLALALHAARETLRSRFPAADERRRALDAALAEDGALDPLRDGSAERVVQWAADASEGEPARSVEFALASDDPEELTLRQARLLGVEGWYSTNILGNRDGEVLDDPESFKTKEESKKSALDYIFQPHLYPELYSDLCHVVRINYYPPRGDNKEGWDNIDLIGWLGYPMQLKINFLCRDSILAAPIVLDSALFLDLARRAGMSGIQEWLSFYYKAPMHAPEVYPEHDLFIQLMKLKNTLRHLMGEELITHLGREYYD